MDKKDKENGTNITNVYTGGGPYIARDLKTEGGDFVGRDQWIAKHYILPLSFAVIILMVVISGLLVYALNNRIARNQARQSTEIAGASILQPTQPPPPIITQSPANTQTPMPVPTHTATLKPTLMPTPKIEELLQGLIEKEGQAVVEQKIELVKEIFLDDAVRTDGSTSKSENAIAWYRNNFDSSNTGRLIFTKSIHENYHFDIQGQTAVVTNDSCGHFTQNNKPTDYTSFQSDHWIFEKGPQGWRVKEFIFNQWC